MLSHTRNDHGDLNLEFQMPDKKNNIKNQDFRMSNGNSWRKILHQVILIISVIFISVVINM